MRAFYWEVIYNFFALVEKDIMCHDILSQNIFDAKTGYSVYCSFSIQAAPYVRIILRFNSLASFWRRKKTFLFLHCAGALSNWIHRSWFLMSYLMMILRSTWSTNTRSMMVSKLNWKWYQKSTRSTIEQWRVNCFSEKWADCTSSLGRKERFCEKCTCHYKLLSSKEKQKNSYQHMLYV